MPRIATMFGVALIALGLIGYFAPHIFGELGEKGTSPTALIPAIIGAIILICGLLVMAAPNMRKHLMHVAAAVATIGALGGIMPLMRSKFDFSKASAVSGLLMIILCALFVVLCVRSFVRARIARSEGLSETPRME